MKKYIRKFIRRTHFWRDAGFDELSELYVSNLLRVVALSIFMVFVPIYMYQQGYSGQAILWLFGIFFTVRIIADFVAAYTVARIGPKHAMVISCLLQIITSSMFLTVPQFNWHIALIALPWGVSASMFFVSYHVVFSKIKHTPKAGRELGHMQFFEKTGLMLGPLVGGLFGMLIGPQYIFLLATLLMIASLWPLFLTNEPVQIRQKLDFKGLPIEKIKRDIFSSSCLGLENTLHNNAWPFFVALFILSGEIYAKLGALSSFGVLASMAAVAVIAKVSDSSMARPILRFSAVVNALTYVARPFATNIGGILVVNTVNDMAAAGFRMPYMKGMYAAADGLPGHRIVYVATLEAFASLLKATVWVLLAILAAVLSLKIVLIIAFIIAATASLGVATERFAVYN